MRIIATVVCFALTVTTASPQTPAPAGTAQTSTAAAGSAAAQTPAGIPADQLLQRGKESYRAGRYNEGAQDLRAAAAAFLSPEEKQRYIETGKLATLAQVEQSLVYLALAYWKLGKEAESRDAVMRLANAERIAPTYAALPLGPDAADFAAVVVRVAPGVNLPQNVQLARGGPATPRPAQTAQMPPEPEPAPAQTAQVPPATVAAAAAAPAAAEDRAETMRQVEQRVSEAHDEIVREADARIAELKHQADARVAAEKAAAEKAAQERIAAGRAAAQKAADERIAVDRAAIQREADAQIAAGRAAAAKTSQEKSAADRAADRTAQERFAADRAANEKAVDANIAADRAIAEKAAQDRIAADRAAAQEAAEGRAASGRAAAGQDPGNRTIVADSDQQRSWITSLRQADSLAQSGNVAEANRTYAAVANASGASREVIAAAAAGLYRTGDFRHAVAAFERLGTFARGEEDLRYYNAVSLFEIGRYYEAKRELACALPYVQATSDVMRYRARIEGMAAQRPMK